VRNQTQIGGGRGGRGNNGSIPIAPGGVIQIAPGGAGTVGPPATQAKAPRSNITKLFANWNVCYSCGFGIEDGHTSVTCPHAWCQTNHQEGFTRGNAQAYLNVGWDPSTKGMHKTEFPGFGRCGAEYKIATKFNHSVDVYANTPNPTQIINATLEINDDDKTIVTLN
jgi:hypothetical protein